MSRYYRTLIQSGKLLDQYPNATVAYSLRKLRDGYTGSAIMIKRSLDNTDQDIGFVGDDLDINSIINFVGYNLWTFSEEWDQGVWVKTGLNITGTPSYINVETAPDGTLTADKIIESTISQNHSTSRQFLVNTGVTYNVSVYLKHGGRDVNIVSILSSLATYSVDVDLINGILSNNTFPITPILENVGSGWYRLSYQATATNTQTRNVITINLRNPTGTPTPINYLGNGVSGVFVWGAQISQTSTVKTYQKTVINAGGNGSVTTWYDQSGNGNNAIQSTPSFQAQIITNGQIVTDINTGKISTLWSTDSYTLTSGITTVQLMYHYMVFNRTSNSNSNAGLSRSNSTIPTMLRWFATTGNITSYLNTTIIHTTNTTTGPNLITTLRDNSNTVKMFKNTTALTTGVTSNVGSTFDNWGNANGSRNAGYHSELVHWNSNQESNRTGIENNVNAYWSIY